MADQKMPDDEQPAVGGLKAEPATPPGKEGAEDGDALSEGAVQINPEALREVPSLPGLDEIEAVILQSASAWSRWTEGLVISVVGNGVTAVIAFWLGMLLASPSTEAGGKVGAQLERSCIVAPVP